MLRSAYGIERKILRHPFLLAFGKHRIGIDITNLAQIVKSFSGPNIGDIAGQHLKGSVDDQVLCQVLTPVIPGFSTVCRVSGKIHR